MRRWLAALIFLLSTSAFAEDQSHCSDAPDLGSALLVKTPEDAIRIAFVMWSMANPRMNGTNETTWAKDFKATLDQCVWSVAEIPVPPEKYSGFVISIGARDGRFLGALVTD